MTWTHPITDYRNQHNLTLRELAEQAELSAATLNRIENGSRRPNIITLFKLAKALHMSDLSQQLEPWLPNTDVDTICELCGTQGIPYYDPHTCPQ